VKQTVFHFINKLEVVDIFIPLDFNKYRQEPPIWLN
jgi:hypothetical protein